VTRSPNSLSRRDFHRSLAALAATTAIGGQASAAAAAAKPLERVRFGQTELMVTRYSQGTAFRQLPRNDNPQTRRVLFRCLDVGINFFDSAEAYSWGESEKLLGRVVAGRRDKVVLCTKAAPSLAPLKDPKTNTFKLGVPVTFSRDVLTRKCEGSLKRLGTDYLDLFLLHDDDGKTPAAEIAETMDRLVRAGKIRYWGLSNFKAGKVQQFAGLAQKEVRSRVAGTEDYYHIAAGLRMPTDLLGVVGNARLGMLAFSPQDCGRLSPGRKENVAYGSMIATLDKVAAELGTTRPRVLIAWSLSNPAVTSVLGGAESEEHVDDNIGGTRLKIPRELMAELNTASRAHTRRRKVRGVKRGKR
jgi:aryl-alcohol dehydrogenase-like predicted oxidoreductase